MALKKATSRKAQESAVAESKPARKKSDLGKAALAVPKRSTYSRKGGKQTKLTDAEKKDKYLKELFCPEGISWLKDVLGIDLSSPKISPATVYEIGKGMVTSEPLEAVVTPLVYDSVKKENVAVQPIKTVASFRIVMPFDRKTFEPVAPSAEQPVFVASYPCYEMLQRGEPTENLTTVEESGAERKEVGLRFTDGIKKALEGLGIREDRLYKTSFNHLPLETMQQILAGQSFECTGTVRIADGFDNRLSVNINGRAKLVVGADGEVKTHFEPQYPSETAGRVLDLSKIKNIGNLEVDLFERDARGYIREDVYHNPIPNKAGKDLVRYGRVFGFADAYVHQKSYSGGRFEENIVKEKVAASVVNGGLCVTRAARVVELGEDGKPLTTIIGGEEKEKFHYELKDAKVNKDGTVRVGTQNLQPVSPRDLEDYKRNIGGMFKGYEKVLQSGEKVVYDAFVYPDNRRGGFANAFSKKVSEDLLARRDEKKAVRKQNYSMGL